VSVGDSDTVKLKVNGEIITIKGNKLKKLAKDNLEAKADDIDNENEVKEATKMSDLI